MNKVRIIFNNNQTPVCFGNITKYGISDGVVQFDGAKNGSIVIPLNVIQEFHITPEELEGLFTDGDKKLGF